MPGKKPRALGVRCRKCGADEWSIRPKGRTCAVCVRRRGKKWYQANKERAAKRTRANALKRNFGLTMREYTMMRLKQGYRCAICGRKPTGKGRHGLHVDHDHETGKVRALLCGPCNTGLGDFRDNPDVLRRAAAYVETHKPAP